MKSSSLSIVVFQERMLDKKWPIRHQAIMNVARLYKEINSKKEPSKIKQVAWMPNKVLHTYYQNTSQVNLALKSIFRFAVYGPIIHSVTKHILIENYFDWKQTSRLKINMNTGTWWVMSVNAFWLLAPISHFMLSGSGDLVCLHFHAANTATSCCPWTAKFSARSEITSPAEF